jgi:hypothetical protein
MSRRGDVGRRLARALLASASAAGCRIRVRDSVWVGWASACFVGARHELVLTARPGEALDEWTAGLAEAELPMADHLVADIAVTRVSRDGGEVRIELEALTVEDR